MTLIGPDTATEAYPPNYSRIIFHGEILLKQKQIDKEFGVLNIYLQKQTLIGLLDFIISSIIDPIYI